MKCPIYGAAESDRVMREMRAFSKHVNRATRGTGKESLGLELLDKAMQAYEAKHYPIDPPRSQDHRSS